MDEFTNSHRSKEEKTDTSNKKQVTKVIKGTAKVKKKGGLAKVSDVFVANDIRNVASHLLFEVLVPATKNAVYDMFVDGAKMLLFGDDSGRRGSSSSRTYVSYDKEYDRRNNSSRSYNTRGSGRYNFDDIILDTRGEAEEVLDSMEGILDSYQIVSVADLYDLVGLKCEHTDNKYGWTNLRSAEVIRTREGYILKLPKPMPIN